MKFDPSKELSESELKDLLAYIQGSGGTVILSSHARERHGRSAAIPCGTFCTSSLTAP